ncbi:MAG: hemolysin [Bacteroidota bacterium]|jgi:hemolysin III
MKSKWLQIIHDFKKLDIEEKANAVTHFLGLISAIILAPFIYYSISEKFSLVEEIGFGFFVFAVLFMLFSSTYYHIQIEARKKMKWYKIDHISIFVLIGASYTVFLLYFMPYTKGYLFIGLMWALILVGVILKMFLDHKIPEVVFTLMYLALGWMYVFIHQDMISAMSDQNFIWLCIGGIGYTIGAIFFSLEKIKFNHAIWHIGVLIGVYGHLISLYLA